MKKEHQKSIAIFIGFIIIVLISYGIISSYFAEEKAPKIDINKKIEEKPRLKKILEIGLIILIIITVILGIIIGYMRLFEVDKKKYLKYESQDHEEYKFRYGDQNFYIKKKDMKNGDFNKDKMS